MRLNLGYSGSKWGMSIHYPGSEWVYLRSFRPTICHSGSNWSHIGAIRGHNRSNWGHIWSNWDFVGSTWL